MPKGFKEIPPKKAEDVKSPSYDFSRVPKEGDSPESSKPEPTESEKKAEKRKGMEAEIRSLEQKKRAAEHNIQTMDTLIAEYQRTANELDSKFLAMTKDIEITMGQHQKAKDGLERTSKEENKLTATADMTAALSAQMEDFHLEVKRQHLSVKQLAKEWNYKQDQRSELDQARGANKKWLEKYKKQKQNYVGQKLDLDLKIDRLKAELEGLR